MKLGKIFTIVIASMFIVIPAMAAQFDFNGSVNYRNDVVMFDFSLNSPSDVTFFTSSWDDGNFDPILAVWREDGSKIYERDDIGYAGSMTSNGISYTYGVFDSIFSLNLGPGNYMLSLTTFDNFANGSNIEGGFRYDSRPLSEITIGHDYSLHILNVDTASTTPTPIPAALVLFGSGILGIAGLKKKSSK